MLNQVLYYVLCVMALAWIAIIGYRLDQTGVLRTVKLKNLSTRQFVAAVLIPALVIYASAWLCRRYL